MTVRGGIKAALGGAIAAVAGLYAYWVHGLTGQSPGLLLACLDSDPAPVAWHCKAVLQLRPLSPQQVVELNSIAGIRLPLYIADSALGKQLARSFVSQGVDVNAPDTLYRKLTALHSAVLGPDLRQAQSLLELGARTDVKDVEGRTPLELARDAARRHPEDSKRKEMVALLERAESAAAR